MRRLTLVYFFDDRLGPSRIQDTFVQGLEKQFKNKISVRRINEKETESMQKYRITETPTIVFEINGKERERFVGLTQELFLRRAIEKLLKQ